MKKNIIAILFVVVFLGCTTQITENQKLTDSLYVEFYKSDSLFRYYNDLFIKTDKTIKEIKTLNMCRDSCIYYNNICINIKDQIRLINKL